MHIAAHGLEFPFLVSQFLKVKLSGVLEMLHLDCHWVASA
jgi:hypothetical protein